MDNFPLEPPLFPGAEKEEKEEKVLYIVIVSRYNPVNGYKRTLLQVLAVYFTYTFHVLRVVISKKYSLAALCLFFSNCVKILFCYDSPQ